MDILKQLAAIKESEEIKRDNDVVFRVLSSLIRIEKEAMYGVRVSNKTARIDKIFDDGFDRYKESGRASSKD